MKTVTMLALLLLLAACAGQPPKIEYRNVEVPVPVPCAAKLPPEPVFAFDVAPADAGLYDSVRALLIEREQRIAYEGKLKAAVAGCQ